MTVLEEAADFFRRGNVAPMGTVAATPETVVGILDSAIQALTGPEWRVVLVLSSNIVRPICECPEFAVRFLPTETVDGGLIGTFDGTEVYADNLVGPSFVSPNQVVAFLVNKNNRILDVMRFYYKFYEPVQRAVQTKPVPAGTPVLATQFTGDPSIHPSIFWEADEQLACGVSNRGHWRFGGEGHGGRMDTGSSWLNIGDWVVDNGPDSYLIPAHIFHRNWQLATE